MYQAMPYNQFYGPQFQPQMQRMQQQPQPQIQPEMQFNQQPIYRQPTGLQGKSVDNVEVVKATDIPLDGSISYFPLTDGSAIVTKQLQQDGTSKTIIYRPSDEKEEKNLPKYITVDEFDKAIKKIDNSDLKDELKTIKRQIKDITEDIKDINEDMKHRKD